MGHSSAKPTGAPEVVDRNAFEAEIRELREKEKAHTRAGDALAAARRRLPMVRMDASTPLVGETGEVTLLEAFEGRRMLIAYYFMWHAGRPAAEQCEGCTLYTSQIRDLSLLHSRDVTYATFSPGTVRRKQALPRLYGVGYALVFGFGFTGNPAGGS